MRTFVFAENKNEKNKAEDARPIIGNNFIVVADGLGSGIKHTETLKDIDNFDAFFKHAFKEILKPEKQNIERVKESFATLEFNAEKFSSAYFASAVSALTIYDIFENGKSGDLLGFLAKLQNVDKDALAEKEKFFGNYFAEKIADNLNMFKENLALADERPQIDAKKNNFLPTTIVGCAFEEKKDIVNTLFFWAGDSRGYILDDQGLAPATDDDQEHSGGSLNNFIQILRPFHINCKFRQFNKPVIVMVMSDGVFDKKQYGRAETKEKCLIPMEFEIEVLSLFINSSSMDNFRKNAEIFYAESIRGDDSATIALAAFGFKDYTAIQDLCKKRLHYLKSIMSLFLEGFDLGEYEKGKSDIKKEFNAAKAEAEPILEKEVKIYLETVVQSALKKRLSNDNSPIKPAVIINLQEQVKNDIQLKLQHYKDELNKIRLDLNNELESKWLYFRTLFTEKELPKRWFIVNQNQAYLLAETRKDNALIKHSSMVQEKQQSMMLLVSEIEDQMELIKKLEICKDDYILFTECRKAISEIFDYIEAAIKGKDPIIKNIKSQEEIIKRIAGRVWKQEQNIFPAVKILSQGNSGPLIKFQDNPSVSRIIEIVEKISLTEAKIKDLEGKLRDHLQIIINTLYKDYNDSLIQQALEADGANTGIHVPSELKQLYQECKARLAEYEKSSSSQYKAYQSYKDSYCRYYKGDLA